MNRQVYPVAIILVLIMACLPIISVDYLAANDYPFHLARISILAGESTQLGQFYDPGSWLVPNIAMDAIAVPLAKLTSAEWGFKAFLVLSQCLFVGGFVFLHRAVHKHWSSLALLSGGLVFSGIFIFGFYNYLFAAALTLWATGCWILTKGLNRYLLALAFSLVLMLSHMGGFAIFAIVIATYQCSQRLTAFCQSRKTYELLLLCVDSLPFIASLVLFFLLSPVSDKAADPLVYGSWIFSLPAKVLFTFYSGVVWSDILWILGLLAANYFSYRQWGIGLDQHLLAGGIALWIAFILLPENLLGSNFADVRLVPIAAIYTLLSLRLKHSDNAVFGTFLVLLMAIKTLPLLFSWQSYQQTYRNADQMLSTIPDNSLLLTASYPLSPKMWIHDPAVRGRWTPPVKHLAAYAAVGRSVFVPMIFADPYKQPIVVKPELRAIKEFQTNNPIRVADDLAMTRWLSKIQSHITLDQWGQWPSVMVFVIGTPRADDIEHTGFVLASQSKRFSLLRYAPNQLEQQP